MWRSAHAALLLAAFVVALAAGSGTAHAVTYIFSGDCDAPCGGVSGSISFDDAALVPGNVYPAPTSFSFSFPGIEISAATALGFGLFAFPPQMVPVLATVPADILEFDAIIRTGESVAPSDGGDALIILPNGRWSSTGSGVCSDTLCTEITSPDVFVEGSGAWSTLPAPTAAWMLAAGLAWLGGLRARRCDRA